jgi:hypothetical protein
MANLRKGKESLSPKSVGKISQEPYSYEHRITLDQDTLDRLGIGTPKVGDKYHVLGHGEVTHVSQNSSPGEKSTRVELQMKRMGLKKGGLKGGNGLLSAVNSGISEADKDNG